MNTVLFTLLFAPERVLILCNCPYFVSLTMGAACRSEDGKAMWIPALLRVAAEGDGQLSFPVGWWVCGCVCVCMCVCVALHRLRCSDCADSHTHIISRLWLSYSGNAQDDGLF